MIVDVVLWNYVTILLKPPDNYKNTKHRLFETKCIFENSADCENLNRIAYNFCRIAFPCVKTCPNK